MNLRINSLVIVKTRMPLSSIETARERCAQFPNEAMVCYPKVS